jgi:Flp pilus assembly pilin Flp
MPSLISRLLEDQDRVTAIKYALIASLAIAAIIMMALIGTKLSLISRLLGDQGGVAAIQYSLTASLISMAAIAMMALIGTKLTKSIQHGRQRL